MAIGKNIAKIIAGSVAVAVISLTAHVTLDEATITNTGLPNKPDSAVVATLKVTLENIYEPCRAHFKIPIYISSGFRSEDVNRAVGGQQQSQHRKGEAIDLDADVWGGLTNRQLFQFIYDSLEYDQLIMEGGPNGWVHVSFRECKNRNKAFFLQ